MSFSEYLWIELQILWTILKIVWNTMGLIRLATGRTLRILFARLLGIEVPKESGIIAAWKIVFDFEVRR